MTQNAPSQVNGLLLVHKPVGISSFDVIRRLRQSTGVRKIGHAGTLDPLASGLMLMLFGTACKQADAFLKLDKTYVATIRLGMTSSTGDNEGELTQVSSREPTEAQLRAVLAGFVGEVRQTPPIYSAIKIDGKEAYKRARAGETPTMPARTVMIYQLELMSYEYPSIQVEAAVGSGTYIRTLAHDIGARLSAGAYLDALVRTRIGQYALGDAQAIEGLTADTLHIHLRPL